MSWSVGAVIAAGVVFRLALMAGPGAPTLIYAATYVEWCPRLLVLPAYLSVAAHGAILIWYNRPAHDRS